MLSGIIGSPYKMGGKAEIEDEHECKIHIISGILFHL